MMDRLRRGKEKGIGKCRRESEDGLLEGEKLDGQVSSSPPLAVAWFPQHKGEIEHPGSLLKDTYVHGVLRYDDTSWLLLRPGVLDKRSKIHRNALEDVAVQVPVLEDWWRRKTESDN